MKTDKFNRMIEAFECDFSLIKEGKRTFSNLDKKMKDSRYSLSEDMELMQELSTMLRYGQAEIHLIEKPKTNADRIRNMSDEELTQFIKYARCDALYGSSCIQQPYCEGMLGKTCTAVGKVDKGLLQWLQAEVKEGES